MKIIHKIDELRSELANYRKQNKTLGFIPTMGYLHSGHMSLVENAKKDNDISVVSIFVNPTQFGPGEDLESYPRDWNHDKALLENAGVDVLFNPEANEMYPMGYSTFVEVYGNITNTLCGKSRPGHFKGVTTVVMKLFNLIRPDKAYFGRKDAQQVAVINKMVADMNMDIDIVSCPIVREDDGLAMSSRNIYLNPQERIDARILSGTLKEAKRKIKEGERDSSRLRNWIINEISSVDYADIDYVEIVDARTLESIDTLNGKILIALAVKFGKTRLIDNTDVEVD